MSEDWKAGDIAVCIGSGGLTPGFANGVRRTVGSVKKGRAYRVIGVVLVRDGTVALTFSDLAPPGKAVGWDARCFRKLNDEPEDAEAIRLIKQCRPRIADLPRVTTPVRRPDPAIWSGVDLEGEG